MKTRSSACTYEMVRPREHTSEAPTAANIGIVAQSMSNVYIPILISSTTNRFSYSLPSFGKWKLFLQSKPSQGMTLLFTLHFQSVSKSLLSLLLIWPKASLLSPLSTALFLAQTPFSCLDYNRLTAISASGPLLACLHQQSSQGDPNGISQVIISLLPSRALVFLAGKKPKS